MIRQLTVNNLDNMWRWPWSNLRHYFDIYMEEMAENILDGLLHDRNSNENYLTVMFGAVLLLSRRCTNTNDVIPLLLLLLLPINSVALVRERTIPTERPPPVAEVSANFCG